MDQECERPIRLIEVNASGKYVLSEEGRTFISKISGPIAVISVAGMYRTGKSYLLNRMLLNRTNGFGVGPTVNPCTKGLWCWGKTIPGKTIDGEPINVIIIDTEGIGALDEDQTHDTRIFTLAILSASAFIYNSTGSIDENALQNLSLVVNLTKNIELNTNKSEEEEDDPEDLADYFPAFYWVVRDFSLQLINSEGDQITPKEYLERALAPQKGFSDDVEEKNRIRRLLSSFFKERECFTLVRPVVDEKKLQLLDSLDLDQLRPEFVDQVMGFRRRILGKVKPKMFKGKALDGPMYLCLLSSYVQAINNGAVPNIENAWNYMCQEKCAQAFEESLSFFNEEVEKDVRCVLPTEEEFLVEKLKEIKEKCCDKFEAISVGEKVKFHLKELREKIEEKIESLRQENEIQSEGLLKSYFKKSIVDIENKLRLREYHSFDEFMKELNKFYGHLLENAPVLPKKEEVFLALLKKVIPTAAEIFLKDKSEELKNLKALTDQKESNFHSIIDKLKSEAKELSEIHKEKYTKVDRKRVELELEVEDLKKILEESEEKMMEQEARYKIELEESSEMNKRKESNWNEKLSAFSQQVSQLQSENTTLRCESEKELAIICLKNKQLQSELDETKRKESQTVMALKSLEYDSSNNIKSVKEEYEEKIKEKDLELRQLRVFGNDLEEQNKVIEQELHQLRLENEKEVKRLRENLNKRECELIEISREKEEIERELKKNSNEEIERLSVELERMSDKCLEIEKQYKNQIEGLTVKERNYQTEIILVKQQLEFSELKNQEIIVENQKAEIAYENRIATLIEEASSQEANNDKISELEDTYQVKISQIRLDYETSIKKLSSENENIQTQLSESESETKSLKAKLASILEEKSRIIQELEEKMSIEKGDIEERIENMKSDWKRKEKSLNQKIVRLEEEVEENKEQMERMQFEDHSKSEEAVLQLKNYYEMEKEKLESKIVSEKEKYERKMADLSTEAEQRYREEIVELEEECDGYRERLGELEEELLKEKTNRRMEMDIKNKTISDLEKTNEENKSKIDNKELELLNKIERLQKEHSADKENYFAKYEEMYATQTKMEKERNSLLNHKENSDKVLQLKDRTIEELKGELLAIKEKSEIEKESEKNIRNDINTKLMEDRVEFEKKMALLTQENEYLKVKIEETEKFTSSSQASQDEKYRKIKEDYAYEIKSVSEKSQAELENMENKYEKLKKCSKEKETVMQKSINQLEKELAISNEKIINLADKLKVYEEKQLTENEQHCSSFANLKLSLNKEKEQLKEQLEIEQKERERIESEKSQLNATYQQEKLLLENKNKFLEEGKERYKQEYEETKSKLELIIENNRKKWTQEKANLELNQNEQLSKVEKRYWQEKHDLTESMRKLEIEYENKLKSLEYENRSLNERIALEEQNKMGNHNDTERKLKELTENERKLQTELERLKAMRENELIEMDNHEKDKENLKAKMKEREAKYLALEKVKQGLFYEIEKEKAKWKIEKENSTAKADEQKETIQKYEKEIEKLQRENEKLKVERKCQKASMQSMSRFTSYSMNKTSLEESILKENCSNTSQLSDNSLFFKE